MADAQAQAPSMARDKATLIFFIKSFLFDVVLLPLLNHLLRHVLRVTQWRVAPGLAICAALSTVTPSPICVVRARAVAGIVREGILDDLLLDLGVRDRSSGEGSAGEEEAENDSEAEHHDLCPLGVVIIGTTVFVFPAFVG